MLDVKSIVSVAFWYDVGVARYVVVPTVSEFIGMLQVMPVQPWKHRHSASGYVTQFQACHDQHTIGDGCVSVCAALQRVRCIKKHM